MTTVPERRSRMCGRTALVTFKTPKRFVWNWVSAARELCKKVSQCWLERIRNERVRRLSPDAVEA